MKKQFNLNDYKGNYVMSCATEEEAKIFLQFLDNSGKAWVGGVLYTEDTYWKCYKENTVYVFNENKFDSIRNAVSRGCKILYFDNFNFEVKNN